MALDLAADLAALPDGVDALRALVSAQAVELTAKDAELAAQRLLLDGLRVQLARPRRMQFGRSSERLRAEISNASTRRGPPGREPLADLRR